MSDGYVGRNAAVMRERDERMCVCGHKSISHGSFTRGRVFVGVGMGPCGLCADSVSGIPILGRDCKSFTPRQTPEIPPSRLAGSP